MQTHIVTVIFEDHTEARPERELDYIQAELWNIEHPKPGHSVADRVAVFTPELVERFASAFTLDWGARTFVARYRVAPRHLWPVLGDLELDPQTVPSEPMDASTGRVMRVYSEADYELLGFLLRHKWTGNGYLCPASGLPRVTELAAPEKDA